MFKYKKESSYAECICTREETGNVKRKARRGSDYRLGAYIVTSVGCKQGGTYILDQ